VKFSVKPWKHRIHQVTGAQLSSGRVRELLELAEANGIKASEVTTVVDLAIDPRRELRGLPWRAACEAAVLKVLSFREEHDNGAA